MFRIYVKLYKYKNREVGKEKIIKSKVIQRSSIKFGINWKKSKQNW